MADQQTEISEEQRHLDLAEGALREVVARLEGGPSGGIDAFADDALNAMRKELLRTYTEASGPLYFGRIDSEEETLYVGRHSVHGADNDLLAINWRAPAAEPFYAATPEEPRAVRRRRRLDIDAGEVLGFVDEELAAAAAEDHLTAAIVEDVSRARIGEMRQIVSTITADQYELIAEAAAGPLVIQGGPGTGKTAVGLHRAAWLLYSDRDLARTGVLVVGPNDTFVHYIRQVLPSLGEHSVDQRSIDRVVSTRPIVRAEDPSVALLKGDGRMAELLRRALWTRIEAPDADPGIGVGHTEVIVSAGAIGELQEAVRAAGRGYSRGGEGFRTGLAEVVAERLSPRAADRIRAEGDLLGTIRASAGFRRLAEKSWPRTNPGALLKRAFGNRKRLAELAGDLLDEGEIAALAAHPPGAGPAEMTAADVALLDEARSLVAPEHRAYGHVIVDEAQNLSPMEMRMLARRARGRSMTILGDITQRNTTGVSDWDGFLAGAAGERVTVRRLATSYRVPDDFLAIARRVAGEGSEIPKGVRAAPWRPLAVATASAELATTAADVAGRLAAAGNSVGLVAPADAIESMRRGLRDAGVEFDDATAGNLGGGVNLLDLQVVKGLEFDAILVVEPAALLAERPAGGPGGLYTALTRATRALAIVHAEALPPGLDDAPGLTHASAAELDDIWENLRRDPNADATVTRS
jgi:DNA helicase IV